MGKRKGEPRKGRPGFLLFLSPGLPKDYKDVFFLQYLFPQVLTDLQYFTSKLPFSSLNKVTVLKDQEPYQSIAITAMLK